MLKDEIGRRIYALQPMVVEAEYGRTRRARKRHGLSQIMKLLESRGRDRACEETITVMAIA